MTLRLRSLQVFFDLFDRRDRPAALVSSNCDSKSMDVVYKDVINRSSLAIGQDDAPANQLLLGGMEFGKYVQGAPAARIQSIHVCPTI